MTDNEIVKALERCIRCNERQIASCDGCTLEKYYPYCDDVLEVMCLNLINRQKAEIERLEKELNTLTKQCYKSGIKDLAERLKEKSYIQKPYGIYGVVDVCVIDHIVEEMTEETP